MRRDLELVRRLLLELESNNALAGMRGRDIEGFAEDPRVVYHLRIMKQGGLIEGDFLSGFGCGRPFDAMGLKLTLQEHRKADEVRSPASIRSINLLLKRFGSASFNTLTTALQNYSVKVIERVAGVSS